MEKIGESKWDIIFFAEHSFSQNGHIFINHTESITIEQLKLSCKKAIKHGLQLAIFNVNDGLKLAKDLADFKIPLVVMREPVPNQVAQTFLKFFLQAFSREVPLHLAVRQARERLYESRKDDNYLSWLPITYQNSPVREFKWYGYDIGKHKMNKDNKKQLDNKLITEIKKQIFWVILMLLLLVVYNNEY